MHVHIFDDLKINFMEMPQYIAWQDELQLADVMVLG
jgi:hypothetical protein